LEIEKIYRERFQKQEIRAMRKVWAILVADFFQRFVQKSGAILDLGAGFCFFINQVKAKNKIAIDINPDIKKFANPNVRVILDDSLKLKTIRNNSLDHVFMSNFLEHLADAYQAIFLLQTIYHKLKKTGSVIILTPNFQLSGPSYFDFLDHKFIVTDKNLKELLSLTGFEIVFFKKRFLPFTSKSHFPKWPLLVRFYLKVPLLHLLLGKQSFVVAQKKI